MNEHRAEKLYNGVTQVGDDLIQEAGVVQLPKRKKTASWRWGLIAACLCAALLGTALAASPSLRESFAAALGGFAPYAQEQDGEVYVLNEFEYEVLSAVTDGTTIRVYVQQTDLVEGRFSTEEFDGVLHMNGSGYFDASCVGCDENTGTSLWCLTAWGDVTEPEKVTLFLGGVTRETRPKEGTLGKFIPLELKPMPSMVIARESQAGSLPFQSEEIRLSPLGVTLVTRSEPHNYNFDLSASIRVCLADGTEIQPEGERASGQGTYGDWEDSDSQRKVMVWNFRDAVDLDQVAGVYVGDDYFPVK